MNMKPEWNTYCDNTTAINALCFTYGNTRIYYSYKTPVAFMKSGILVVRVNEWGNTTGKHLNAIDGGGIMKKSRIDGSEFEERLNRIMDMPTNSKGKYQNAVVSDQSK